MTDDVESAPPTDAVEQTSRALAPSPDRVVVSPKSGPQSDLIARLDRAGVFVAGSKLIQRVSDAQAMRQTVVSAALDIVSSDIGKIPFRLVDEQPESVRVMLHTEHLWARKLKLRPNRHQTWVQFWAQAVAQFELRQECVIYRRRASRRDVSPDLVVLQYDEWIQATDRDRFFYDVSASTEGRVALLGFASGRVSSDDVIHVIGRTINGHEGVSTLAVGADAFGLTAMLQEFQAALVKGGTRPTGVVSLPGGFETDAQYERFREQINAAIKSATEAGQPLVLSEDAKFESIGLTADAADLVAAKQQLARDCARIFRMPGHKLGLTEDLNRANVEAMEKAYVDDKLVPICEFFEQAFSAALLTEDEQLNGLRFKFDRQALYARDPIAHAERVEQRFKAGLTFANEARRQIGMDPLPADQDHRSLPVNTAMVFADGRVQIFTSKTDPRDDANDTAPAATATRSLRLVADNH